MDKAPIKAKAIIDKQGRLSDGNDCFFEIFNTRNIESLALLMPQSQRQWLYDRLEGKTEAGSCVPVEIMLPGGEYSPFLIELKAEPPCTVTLVDVFAMAKRYRSINDRIVKLYSAIGLASPGAFFEYEPKEDRYRVYQDRDYKVFEGTLEQAHSFILSTGIMGAEALPHLSDFIEDCRQLKAGVYYTKMKYSSCEEGYRDVAIYTGVINEEDKKCLVGIAMDRYFNHALTPAASSNLDPLTGLYNKVAIRSIAESMLKEQKHFVSFLVMDLDRFKEVNDTYGHMFGDWVLYETSLILRDVVGDKGYVGRIGGDEFFVVLLDCTDEVNQLRATIVEIRDRIEQRFVNDLGSIKLTASVGCASAPKNADNYEDLFLLADTALYRAKFKGRNRYIIYFEPYHGTLEEIKNGQKHMDVKKEQSADRKIALVTKAIENIYDGGRAALERVMEDMLLCFGADEINLYDAKNCNLRYSTEYPATLQEVICPCLQSIQGTFRNMNNLYFGDVDTMEKTYPIMHVNLKRAGVNSIYIHAIRDKAVIKYFAVVMVKGQNHKWSEVDKALFTMLFKTFGTILHK